MKKNNSLVFFSCVVDDVYKEYKIDQRYFDELKETLIREQFYNNKYASACTLEENERSLKKLSFLKKMLQQNYLSIHEFVDGDVAFQEWMRNILSKCRLEQILSVKGDKEIAKYFLAMKRCAIANNMDNAYSEQMNLLTEGMSNASVLQELGLSVTEKGFVEKETPKTNTTEKAVVLEKKISYPVKKIS